MRSLSTITSSLATLELPPGCLPKEKKVKRAYRRMFLIIHPDRAGAGWTKKFQLLQSAYTTVLEFLERRDIMENGEEEEDAKKQRSIPTFQTRKTIWKYSTQRRAPCPSWSTSPSTWPRTSTTSRTGTCWRPSFGLSIQLRSCSSLMRMEDRVMDWFLRVERMTCPARLVVMVWVVVMAIKMTGINHIRSNMVMPGSQVLGKRRREVVEFCVYEMHSNSHNKLYILTGRTWSFYWFSQNLFCLTTMVVIYVGVVDE